MQLRGAIRDQIVFALAFAALAAYMPVIDPRRVTL